MRVQILEKVYHSSENPTLLTSLRRTRELFWIKELGTAKPYGFNDQIKGVGTLNSISCKKTNIYSLFNKQPRRKRSHGKRHYNKRAPQPDVTMSTLVDLVDMKVYTRSTPNCSPYHFHSFAVYKNLLWSQQTLTTLLLSIE